jgi:hypothetical protein
MNASQTDPIKVCRRSDFSDREPLAALVANIDLLVVRYRFRWQSLAMEPCRNRGRRRG